MIDVEDLVACPICEDWYWKGHDACPKCGNAKPYRPLHDSEDDYLIDVPIPMMPSKTIKVKARIEKVVNRTGEPLKTPQIAPKAKRSKPSGIIKPRFSDVSSFQAIIEAQPLPKERPRLSEGHVRTSTKTKGYEKLIQATLAPLIKGDRFEKEDLLLLEIEFCRKGHVKADIDNLTKALMDACNGLLWADDKQVRRIVADVSYGHDEPYTRLAVYQEEGKEKYRDGDF